MSLPFCKSRKYSLMSAALILCFCLGLTVQFNAWTEAEARVQIARQMPKAESGPWLFVKRQYITQSQNLYFDVFYHPECATFVQTILIGTVSHHAPIIEEEFRGLQRAYISEAGVQSGYYRPWELRLGRFAERMGLGGMSHLPTGQILMAGFEGESACSLSPDDMLQLRQALNL